MQQKEEKIAGHTAKHIAGHTAEQNVMQNTMMKLQPVCRKMLHVFRRYFPGVQILKCEP